MSLKSKQFHFLEESNRNINFEKINSIILNTSLNEQKAPKIPFSRRIIDVLGGGVSKGKRGMSLDDLARLGSGSLKAWAEDQINYRNYLANERAQGPLGRLGSQYREAAISTFLAPYRLAPAALLGSAQANLNRTARTSAASQIQYGPVKF